MIATYIEDLITPLTREQASAAMRYAFDDHPIEVAALACAKSALETGRWKAIHRWNFGNIKAGPDYVGQFTSFWCDEILGGRRVAFYPDGEEGKRGTWTVPPGHPQTRFRAYAGPTDGALSYRYFVEKNYPRAFAALLTGDPIRFVHELKAAHYFTADEAPYAKAVASLHREFLAVLAKEHHEEPDDWKEMAELRSILARIEGIWMPLDHFEPSDFADRDTWPEGTPIV